jgi:hypothetical protein
VEGTYLLFFVEELTKQETNEADGKLILTLKMEAIYSSETSGSL